MNATPTPSLQALLAASPAQLATYVAAGHPVQQDALDHTVYQGISLGLPAWVDALAWKTFAKTFQTDPTTGTLRGWNVRTQQTGVDGALVYRRDSTGQPLTFGHYRVRAAAPNEVPAAGGLTLDYGAGGNAVFDPTHLLRDPLIALDADGHSRLLGWIDVHLGMTLHTPSYFLLHKPQPLDHTAAPPRAHAVQP